MLGYIRQEENRHFRPRLTWEEMAGIPFCVLHCGESHTRRRKRRLLRLLRQMARQGVHQAVMPPAMTALCRAEGIAPVSEAPLRQALMEPLLDCFCRQNGLDLHRSTVRLCAKRMNSTVEQAAVMLVQKARYMVLDIGQGQEKLSDRLRMEYGLSAGHSGRGAIMQVCCDDVQAENIPTLWLGQACEAHQRVRYRLLEPWCGQIEEEPQLLSVLFTERKLPVEAFGIKTVEPDA